MKINPSSTRFRNDFRFRDFPREISILNPAPARCRYILGFIDNRSRREEGYLSLSKFNIYDRKKFLGGK